jgi:hypothetical protein
MDMRERGLLKRCKGRQKRRPAFIRFSVSAFHWQETAFVVIVDDCLDRAAYPNPTVSTVKFQIPQTSRLLSSAAMHSGVACIAKRNQVRLRIVAGLAAKLLVMNFKIGHCATRLVISSRYRGSTWLRSCS